LHLRFIVIVTSRLSEACSAYTSGLFTFIIDVELRVEMETLGLTN